MTDQISERLKAAADAVRAADEARETALDERAAAIRDAQQAGWSIRPIAAEMGLPVGSVQAAIRRAS